MGGAPQGVARAGERRRGEAAVRPVRLSASRAAPAAALVGVFLGATGARAQGACDGRPIRSIRVVTYSLFSEDESRLGAFRRGVGNSLHWRTREATVRRELLFAEGQPCHPQRLAESERVLRAQSYVRAARITSRPAADGGVEVQVETRDDWSLRGSIRVASGERGPITRFRLAEENVLGRGIRVHTGYSSLGRESAFELGALHHQVLGRLDAEVLLGTTGVGLVGEQTVLRPFESEFDRRAWRESARYRKEPFPLVLGVLGTVVQPLVAFGGDAGVAVRFGEPGRLLLLGGVLSGERLYAEGSPQAAQPQDDPLAAALLAGRFAERRRVRVHLLLGARALRFHPRAKVDAVNALEDVREGVEGGLVLGKSLFGGGGLQRDWFTAAELSSGAALGAQTLVFARGKAEGRYLIAEQRWDNVLAAGEVLIYHDLGSRGVLVLGWAGAGGWQTSAPFQLLLAGPSGIRGYGDAGRPVGRRVVLHAEHRYLLGTAFDAVDVGTAAFVDLGRGWGGDAPFGEDTGLLGAIGGGLRLAFPSGSRVAYRLDVAMPVPHGRGVEVRIGLRQHFGFRRGEADDVTRSREQVSSVTVFNFPRF